MGRLTLNMLLSFAQFEREVIGERIRDKVAASRKRGMWMGGFVPLGYDVKDRKLVVNEAEAALVRMIFERFPKLGSATALVRELRAEGVTSKRGSRSTRAILYKLLRNRRLRRPRRAQGHGLSRRARGDRHPGLWDKAQSILARARGQRAAGRGRRRLRLLKGLLIFGPTGRAMSPTHTRKGGKLYRYYVSLDVIRNRDLMLPRARSGYPPAWSKPLSSRRSGRWCGRPRSRRRPSPRFGSKRRN